MHKRNPEVIRSKVKARHCPERGYYCPGKQKLRVLITRNIAKVIKLHGSCNQGEFRYRTINHEIMISAKKEVPRFIQLISEVFFMIIKKTDRRKTILSFISPPTVQKSDYHYFLSRFVCNYIHW